MQKFVAVLAAALSFGTVASAGATTITNSLSAWQTGVGGPYASTSSFGVPDGTNIDSAGLGGFVTLQDGQAFSSVDGFTVYTLPSPPGEACCTTSGTGQVIDIAYNNETFIFGNDIAALGFYVQPSTTDATPVTVTLYDGTMTSQASLDFSSQGTQFIGFYGAAGSGIDAISITFTDSSAVYGFDVGQIVDAAVSTPEPMSMAVLLTGVTGLGMVRRRRA